MPDIGLLLIFNLFIVLSRSTNKFNLLDFNICLSTTSIATALAIAVFYLARTEFALNYLFINVSLSLSVLLIGFFYLILLFHINSFLFELRASWLQNWRIWPTTNLHRVIDFTSILFGNISLSFMIFMYLYTSSFVGDSCGTRSFLGCLIPWRYFDRFFFWLLVLGILLILISFAQCLLASREISISRFLFDLSYGSDAKTNKQLSFAIMVIRGFLYFGFVHILNEYFLPTPLESKWITVILVGLTFILLVLWSEMGKPDAKTEEFDSLDDYVRILLDKVEAIAILLAAVLFILEAADRRQDRIISNLSVIDSVCQACRTEGDL
jgi:hypothetical protein